MLTGRASLLWACMGLILLTAGCASRATSPVAPEPVMSTHAPMPLHDVLYRLRAEQYGFDPDITTPPAEGETRYFRIAREPALITVAEVVTAFDAPRGMDPAAGADRNSDTASGTEPVGLAFARTDGTVRVFGDDSYGVLQLPEETTAIQLSYDPIGRTLAALLDDGRIFFKDLSWASSPKTVSAPGTVGLLATGGGGLGAVLTDGTVLAGRGTQLRPVGRVGARALDAAFAPGGGVLLVGTDAGAVTAFNLREGAKMSTRKLERGQFTSADIQGRTVLFTSRSGRVRALDAATGRELGAPRVPVRFRLDGGRLTYRTWRSIMSRTDLSGYPDFDAWYSTALEIVQVRDLDGLARCYGAGDGRPVPCPPNSDWDINGWRNVQLDQEGRFCRSGSCYRLADPVFHLEHDRLMCRFIPESGFYLWWHRTERPGASNPMNGRLPVRQNIREDEAPVWLPLLPPDDLP